MIGVGVFGRKFDTLVPSEQAARVDGLFALGMPIKERIALFDQAAANNEVEARTAIDDLVLGSFTKKDDTMYKADVQLLVVSYLHAKFGVSLSKDITVPTYRMSQSREFWSQNDVLSLLDTIDSQFTTVGEVNAWAEKLPQPVKKAPSALNADKTWVKIEEILERSTLSAEVKAAIRSAR
jgi:hypothetical protein